MRSLASLAHVDKAVIGPFLHRYWQERSGSEQQRLEAACAALEAEGLSVTMAGLCSRAHVGWQAAAAFLQDYHPVVRPKQRRAGKVRPARPAKASPQVRLREAYTRLVAQGELITKTRLREVARVSTDTAGAFLRAMSTGDGLLVAQT